MTHCFSLAIIQPLTRDITPHECNLYHNVEYAIQLYELQSILIKYLPTYLTKFVQRAHSIFMYTTTEKWLSNRIYSLTKWKNELDKNTSFLSLW